MQQAKANDELFPIIIESLPEWDDKMQKECATSFITCIQNDLFSDRNYFKIITKSIHIVNEALSLPEHDELVEPWVDVLGMVCTKVHIEDQERELVPFLQELLNNKSPIENRKVGNKILFSVCTNIGEKGMDECPSYVKLMKSVFVETNYKLRRDGIILMQKYFKLQKAKELTECDRFQNIYLPELLGYLEDEDQQLVCDAIDASYPLIEFLDDALVHKYFIP